MERHTEPHGIYDDQGQVTILIWLQETIKINEIYYVKQGPSVDLGGGQSAYNQMEVFHIIISA